MNQEEVVFSFAKYKAAFKKYFYIVIICVVAAVAYICFGLISGNKNPEKVVKEEALTKIEPATQDVYFKKSAYIAVDWSEMYPEPVLSEDASVSDREKATSIINDQINIEKNILNNSNAIFNYKEYKELVDKKLEDDGMTKLTDLDYIWYGVYSEKQIIVYVYTHSNIERTEALLDAAYTSFIEIATQNFDIGKCTKIGDSYVYMARKNVADGSYTDSGMKASDYISDNNNKINDAEEKDNSAAGKKQVVVAICIIVSGFVIIGIIAFGDKKIYTKSEIEGTAGIEVFGTAGDKNLDDILTRRIIMKLKLEGTNSITIVTENKLENSFERIIKEIKKAGLEANVFTYADNVEKISDADMVMVAVKSGVDTNKQVKEMVNNLKIDKTNVIGYIWIK